MGGSNQIAANDDALNNNLMHVIFLGDMTCPHCQNYIQTEIESEVGPMAWIVAGVLCITG